jgi:hypothetical protein
MRRQPSRVLLIANRTAAGEHLCEAVSNRAADGPCRFTLLVPRPCHGLHRVVDPEDHGWDQARRTIERARPVLEEAAGAPIAALVGSHDPLGAALDALNMYDFDEVIVSTLPVRLSRWLHMDLPRKIAATGVPVTTVTASQRSREFASA